jgi:DNA-binding transcriptional LysR family regulator
MGRGLTVLAAHVTAGGFAGAARLAGIQPTTVKRHLADLSARSGLTAELQ